MSVCLSPYRQDLRLHLAQSLYIEARPCSTSQARPACRTKALLANESNQCGKTIVREAELDKTPLDNPHSAERKTA